MAQLHEIPDVEVFATGYHHGRWWRKEDLKQIHANFHKLSFGEDPYFRPPVAVGHEEGQRQLKDTGLESAGVVAALRFVDVNPTEARLVAHYRDVPGEVAEWIRAKKYRTTSAEIWPDFVDHNGVSHGLTMRRVSMLGAEPPEQKQLKEIPQPVIQHSAGQTVLTCVFRFAENVMTRDDMVALLKGTEWGAKLSQEFIDSLSDEQLAMLIKDIAPKPPEEGATPPGEPAPEGGQMAAPPAPIQGGAPSAPPSGQPQQVVFKYSDTQLALLEGRQKRLDSQLAAADRLARQRLQDEKSSRIKAAIDWLTNDGKGNCRLKPADAPAVKARLERADAVNAVVKFGDSGKMMTELEAQIEELKAAQPVMKFSDSLPDPAAAGKYDAVRKGMADRLAAKKQVPSLEKRLGLMPLRGTV